MKKSIMIWLIVAACLVLVGSTVFSLSMSANRWDFNLLNSEKLGTETFDIDENFRSISINSDTEDIVFRLSDDGKCKVVCCDREKVEHTVLVQDETLSIECIDSGKWYDHISLLSIVSPTITVYLPQTEYASLSIEESTGNIFIPKNFLFGSMDIDLSTGDVDCRASSSGLIRIQTSTGNIISEGLSAGELDLSVLTGHVNVQTVICEGNVGVNVSTGKANLTDVSCKSISSVGNTGDITLNNVITTETISIERDTGDVRFEKCDAGELIIDTDTGDVTGSLLSDKVFTAHSSTGRVDVPETDTGGKCTITADTGNIRITIVNK